MPLQTAVQAAPPPTRSQTFVDPAGDQNGLAPDITTVVVSSDGSGRITFELTIRNYNTIKPRVSLTVLIDADRNGASGLFGADYLLTSGYQVVDKFGAGAWRWNGTSWLFGSPSSYSSSFLPKADGGVQRFEINKRDLGNTSGFNFSVNGYWFISEPQNYDGDTAPNPTAVWSYRVVAASSSRDSDHDGIPDAGDKCPRAGALFDFNRNGCTGPFRRMRPDLKFRALGYSSYITMVASRIENLPPGARVEVRCQSACRVRARQTARSPVVVLTELHGKRLTRGAAVEIRAVKPGWIGYYARIAITGTPLATHTTERCLPAIGEQVPTPCGRIERGR